MQKDQEEMATSASPYDEEMDSVSSTYDPIAAVDEWVSYRDDYTLQQQSAIPNEEAEKLTFVSDKPRNEEERGKKMQQAQEQEQASSSSSPYDVAMDCVSSSYNPISSVDHDWTRYIDDDITQQQSAIRNEAEKLPFVSDKEFLSALAAEYQLGSPILQEKIEILGEQYAAIRRTRGDGNCFFRCFMFAYLEHVLESQDKAEVVRITASIEQCKKTLQSLGYADFTFEDFFSLFLEQLESVVQGQENSISHDELVKRSRDQSISDHVVMFFRFVTSGEIQRRREFFEPFVLGLTNGTLDQFCKSSVEPMGEESDHVHITALSDALGVPIRIVYLDNSLFDNGGVGVNHYDFVLSVGVPQNVIVSGSEPAKPKVTLLYRPGHYDILYPK